MSIYIYTRMIITILTVYMYSPRSNIYADNAHMDTTDPTSSAGVVRYR